MKIDQNKLPKIAIASILFSALLILSHWLFFKTLHQEGIIRGINAIFVIVGNLYAIGWSLVICVNVAFKKIPFFIGVFSALLLGVVGFHCLRSTFVVMVSV